MSNPLLFLDDTAPATLPEKRAKKDRTGPTYDVLMQADPSGRKLRDHILYLESRLEAREKSGTDRNVMTFRLALEFYADTESYRGEDCDVAADAGRRARTAIEAVDYGRR